ncbi:putative xyloglucan endotransglucosylase/hydrolase protein 1 [Gastrolobium bilobum]|uniref:putative xyloglucan endotransglucosylase/hydrolase protein 1 n=1 Tax=Gastrolobium bilobum TaxID=150636 RepID=UPI002AB0DAED|nr:putative xyloglucan endotransglucosylase/hydrolase protein 1 [Gastrolobium bilobum]
MHVNGTQDDNVPFEQNYAPLWGQENIRLLNQSREVQLTLDQHSGCGFQSSQKYGSGWFNIRIKLPQKDSTTVITTFYFISDSGATRDEIDFEFLGSNKQRPYLLHTNIYTKGQGGREQRIILWFDPTADFHNYTLLWNQQQIVFFVDDTPIRVFKNTTSKGGSFPTQTLRIMATIWTSTWASGGLPVKWSDAPFEAHYKGFGINNACQTQNTYDQECYSSKYWWNADKYQKLNPLQQQAYNNVRKKYLNYDYCTKIQSPECQG